MGMHLETQGDAPARAAAYQRAERLDPTSAEIPAALAELYARLNRPADAIAAGERAVKANPTNPRPTGFSAACTRGCPRCRNTRQAERHTYTERAIANLEKANRNAHPSVPTMLGRFTSLDGQYEKAIAMLVPFVTDQPDQVDAVAHARGGLSGHRSRCRGYRAAREIGCRMRPSCTARSGRSIRMPAAGTMPPARLTAPSKSGRRVCRCARSGRPRC